MVGLFEKHEILLIMLFWGWVAHI